MSFEMCKEIKYWKYYQIIIPPNIKLVIYPYD